LESILLLSHHGEALETSLAHDIFRKLHLSPPELTELVPHLQADKITVQWMVEYVKKRFVAFELLKRTVLCRGPGNQTAGAFGQALEDKTPKAHTKEGRRKHPKTENKDKVPQDPPKKLRCFYCAAKKMPDEHSFIYCEKIGPAQRGAVGKLGRCTDCLQTREEGHACRRTLNNSTKLKMVFCALCSCNVKFCTDKENHVRSALPEPTSGCLALLTPDPLAAYASTLSDIRSNRQLLIQGLEDSSPGSVNKGRLGRPASLYTALTLVNGEERLRVNVLVDSGSESSYYHPAIEAMAVRSVPRAFKLETLAMAPAKTETHQGLQSSFVLEMPEGGALQIDLLRHDGLQKRSFRLKPKLLTVPAPFARLHKLEKQGLVSTHENCQFENDKSIIIAGGPLGIILGQDLVHLAPALVDTVSDEHGRVDLWLCPLQDRLLVSGNRSWPAADEELDDMLRGHATRGLHGSIMPEETGDSAPTTALMGAATECILPVARVAEKRSALHYLSEPDPPTEGDEEGSGDEEPPSSLQDPHILQQARALTARSLLAAGRASSSLHKTLHSFAYQDPQPEHRLHSSCVTCKACVLCMEGTNGESYYLKIATNGFRQNCLRLPMPPRSIDDEKIPIKKFFKISYLQAPGETLQGLNLVESVHRHYSLRRALQALPEGTQQEFSSRLTNGLKRGYWEVVPGFDILTNLQKEQERRQDNGRREKSRDPPSNTASPVTHFLPCGVVLKEDTRAKTKARLVLDPSRSVNTSLIPPPNLENQITSILRRLTGLPVLAFSDISEAFFKMRLDLESAGNLCFILDQEETSGRLSAGGPGATKMVCLRPTRSVMGISQSPCYLSIAKLQLADDMELKDPVLAHHIRSMSYVDDMGSGLETSELARVPGIFDQNTLHCADPTCCGPKDPPPPAPSPAAPAAAPDDSERLLPSPDDLSPEATPLDEQRATRHLMQGQVGRTITHLLAKRVGRLEALLRSNDMATRGISCNLESQVCRTYLNSLVLHYARILSSGKEPEESDMDRVPVAEGFTQVDPTLHRWYRPWRESGKELQREAQSNRDKDPIIQISGPPGCPVPEFEASAMEPGQSTMLGYLWKPYTDTLSTEKIPYVNLLPARRGLRPAAGRLRRPEDVVALHKALPKGLTLRHCLAAAHNLYDPLSICPWGSVQLKYCYRLAVVDSPPGSTYNTKLSDIFVANHLAPGIEALLYAKRHLAQHRSWRLPACIDYANVRAELPILVDGAFGILSGAAAISYLVQRYQFGGQERAKIYLYGAATELSPLSKPYHQVQAEMAAADLGQKQAVRGRRYLAEAGLAVTPHLLSDSQTVLTICSKMAVSLELATGLVVSRVQMAFGLENMYHIPGEHLLTSVDLLTRYDPRLYQKITKDFYAPPWLKLPLNEQPITLVSDMVKVADPYLPYLCKRQMMFAIQGNESAPGLLAAQADPAKGLSTTGKGWRGHPTCQNPCFLCNTSAPQHPQDSVLLKQATEKKEVPKKTLKARTLNPKAQVGLSRLPATVGSPGTLAALGLSVESAMKPRRTRRTAKGPKSGLPRPPRHAQDTNPFSSLLGRRWGYRKAVRVLAACLQWRPTGPDPPMIKALKVLFRGEAINSSTLATDDRRGNTSLDLEKVEGVVLLKGRDLAGGPEEGELSLMQQEDHRLFPQQLTSYLVPLIHSSTALALAVSQEVHNGHPGAKGGHCGESEATLAARVSRYFHLSGSPLITCRTVVQACHGCRRTRGRPGKDTIRRLRYIGPTDLREAASVEIDIAGPFLVYLQAKQVGAPSTRALTAGKRRTVVKRWALLAVDVYSGRLEVSELEDLLTSSVIGGLNEIFAANGWRTTRLALDPGSSLAPGAKEAMIASSDQDPEVQEEEENRSAREHLVNGLQEQGFTIRPCYAKSPWRQARVESLVATFKRTLYSSLPPGTLDLTVSSFGRFMRLATSMINGRPVVLIPAGGRNPGEGMLCSPSSLRGPSHAAWSEAAASRDARGQYAIIKKLEANFQKNWITFYSRRLRANTKLDRPNCSDQPIWPVGTICLILDLPGRAGRLHPHPRLGRIEKYLDDDFAHAWVAYAGPHGTAHVDRPLSKLVYLTNEINSIPQGGLYFEEEQPAPLPLEQPALLPLEEPALLPPEQPALTPPEQPVLLPVADQPAPEQAGHRPPALGPSEKVTATPVQPRRGSRVRAAPARFRN
jgi:hypothetical protein